MGSIKKLIFKGGVSIGSVGIPLGNIISRYTFENNVDDVKGDNDGTSTDLTYVNGCIGKEGVFNGTSSIVTIPHDSSFDFSDGTNDLPFSISFWVETSSTAAQQYIFTKGINFNDASIDLRILSGVQLQIILYTDIGNNIFSSVSSLDFTNGLHCVITYNGDKDSPIIGIYINGTLMNSNNVIEAGTYTGLYVNTYSVYLGQRSDNARWLDGILDEVIFWNKELSSEEISILATDQLNCIDIEPAPVAEIPLQNVISRYKFEDNVKDFVGLNDGTPTDLTYSDEGCIDKVGVFNGTTSKAELPINSLSEVDSFSVSHLVRSNDSITEQRTISLNDNTGMPYTRFSLNQGGTANKIYVFVYGIDGGTNQSIEIFSTSYDVTQWNHLTVTVVKNQFVKFYINGDLIGQEAIADFQLTNETGNHLGASRQGSVHYLNGNLDEVIFWDKELSPDEISKLATDQLNCINIDPSVEIPLDNLISYYQFENNVLDSVGNNDGTATNVTYTSGQVGDAGVFNGSTSKVLLPTDFLPPLPSFSVHCVFKANDLNTEYRLFGISDNVGMPFILLRLNNTVLGRIGFYVYNNNTGTEIFSDTYDSTVYTQVTATMTENGNFKLYINADLVGTESILSFTRLINQNYLGIGRDGITYPFKGEIDNTSFFNKELSQEEVTAIYNKHNSGLPLIDPPAATGAAFSTSTTGTVFSGVCNLTSDTTRYHDGTELFIEVGDKVFEDEQMQIPFDGAGQYYKVLTDNYIQITNGSVVAVDLCGI